MKPICNSCKKWESDRQRYVNVITLFKTDIVSFEYDSHRVTELYEIKNKVSKFNIFAKLRKEKKYDIVTLFYYVHYRCTKCFTFDKFIKWTYKEEKIKTLVEYFKQHEIY